MTRVNKYDDSCHLARLSHPTVTLSASRTLRLSYPPLPLPPYFIGAVPYPSLVRDGYSTLRIVAGPRRHPLPLPGNLFHHINSCVGVVFGGPTGAGET